MSSGGKGACRLLTGAASTEVAAVPPYPGLVADTGVDEVLSGHGQRGGCERLSCLGCSAGDRYLGWRGEASEIGEGPEREATVSSSHLDLPRLGFSSSVLYAPQVVPSGLRFNARGGGLSPAVLTRFEVLGGESAPRNLDQA